MLCAATALLASACGQDRFDTASTTSLEEPTPLTTSAPPTVAPTTVPVSTTAPDPPIDPDRCDGTVPFFAASLAMVDALNIDGTPGSAPGTAPAADDQSVSFWERDLDIVIEMRWPPDPLPGSDTFVFDGDGFTAEVWPEVPEPGDGMPFALVSVPGKRDDPCEQVSVTAVGPDVEPGFDALIDFVSGMRPASERESYVAQIRAEQDRAPASELDPGQCAVPVSTSVDASGYPTPETVRTLAENFLLDRLSGDAAQDCLTVTGLESFDSATDSPYPRPCLSACDGRRLVAGSVAVADSFGAQLVVTYRDVDGTETEWREHLDVRGSPDGEGGWVARIRSVWVAPVSFVDEAAARAVVEDLLDALAAEEWEIAATYLVNEGVSDQLVVRLGKEFERAPVEVLEAFCGAAACGASYEIGGTTDVTEFSRTLEVVFATADTPTAVAITVGMFEGVITAGDVPPDGSPSSPAEPIDVRLFGSSYDGDLIVVRRNAVEWIASGRSSWNLNFDLRFLGRFEAAGGSLLGGSVTDAVGIGVYSADGSRREFSVVPAELVGAAAVGDRSLAFIADTGGLRAVDVESDDEGVLLTVDHREETVYGVDAAGDRLLVTFGIGESIWYELYEFDAARLEAGMLVTRIEPPGFVGVGTLSPDATTIATTIDERFDIAPRSVGLIDAASGAVVGLWEIDDPPELSGIDYDGRWIVASTSAAGVTVIDTTTGERREVATSVRVLFG